MMTIFTNQVYMAVILILHKKITRKTATNQKYITVNLHSYYCVHANTNKYSHYTQYIEYPLSKVRLLVGSL